MRLSILAAVGVLGCGGVDRGAVLTVSSPDGPMAATRIEIVLASADPQFISTVKNQRISPAKLEEAAVIYYRQRATGGVVTSIGQLDSFVVRVEPDATAAPDEAFIPFVLAYDDDTLVGIGSVNDGAGDPSAIKIKDGGVIKYTVTMQALTAASPTAPIRAGEHMIVGCLDAMHGPWTSGVAWQGASGIQRRLLLPDVATDATATDATSRSADLDCDEHEASSGDCDDLREAFHRGSGESCDGVDTNCDGSRYEVLQCPLSSAPSGCIGRPGLQVCDELNPLAPTSCRPDPACTCADGTVTGCTRCVLDFMATSISTQQTPCAPSVGLLTLTGCTEALPCTIEVVGTTGGWDATVASLVTGPFSKKAVGVHAKVVLRVKRGGDVDGVADASVGSVQLLVTQGAGSEVIGVDLELGVGPDTCALTGGSGDFQMTCSP